MSLTQPPATKPVIEIAYHTPSPPPTLSTGSQCNCVGERKSKSGCQIGSEIADDLQFFVDPLITASLARSPSGSPFMMIGMMIGMMMDGSCCCCHCCPRCRSCRCCFVLAVRWHWCVSVEDAAFVWGGKPGRTWENVGQLCQQRFSNCHTICSKHFGHDICVPSSDSRCIISCCQKQKDPCSRGFFALCPSKEHAEQLLH
jgi:hypothetical protein